VPRAVAIGLHRYCDSRAWRPASRLGSGGSRQSLRLAVGAPARVPRANKNARTPQRLQSPGGQLRVSGWSSARASRAHACQLRARTSAHARQPPPGRARARARRSRPLPRPCAPAEDTREGQEIATGKREPKTLEAAFEELRTALAATPGAKIIEVREQGASAGELTEHRVARARAPRGPVRPRRAVSRFVAWLGLGVTLRRVTMRRDAMHRVAMDCAASRCV
jgi:hypothetical protein